MIDFLLFYFFIAPIIITSYICFKMGMWICDCLFTLLENSVYNVKQWMIENNWITNE